MSPVANYHAFLAPPFSLTVGDHAPPPQKTRGSSFWVGCSRSPGTILDPLARTEGCQNDQKNFKQKTLQTNRPKTFTPGVMYVMKLCNSFTKVKEKSISRNFICALHNATANPLSSRRRLLIVGVHFLDCFIFGGGGSVCSSQKNSPCQELAGPCCEPQEHPG